MITSPNQAAPVNAPVALGFPVGHVWRRVTKQRRWPISLRHMSRLLFSLISAVIFLGANLGICEEKPGIRLHQAEAYLGGGTNQWWLPLERLERLPRWRGEGNPPVSISKALKIARRWIKPKAGAGDVDHVLLRPINPDASEAKYRLTYFYTIEFCVAPYGNHITCVVLMDGSVLEPNYLPWREPGPNTGSS
jgi:hypothetical protein